MLLSLIHKCHENSHKVCLQSDTQIFFVPLNWYGHPKIKHNFFENKVCKYTIDQAGECILSQSKASSSKNFTDRALNHGEGVSLPVKYTVAVNT